ncbi:MAG: arsenate reductase ArsC [Methylococcaceae bacterium]
MSQSPLYILVVCTGNSCRSVLGEALFNHHGAGRFRAFSAGSHPIGRINENALATLARHGLPAEGYTSQSWDEFEDSNIDIMISVCDSAAGETCPVCLGSAIRGHWGLQDPAHVTGSTEVIEAAFETAYATMEKRIQQLLALPLETLSGSELSEALNKIGEQIV